MKEIKEHAEKHHASHSDRIKALAEHHPHKAEDKKAISKLASHHRACGGGASRSKGGPAAKRSKTQVNVVVAGRGGNGPSGPGAAPPMPVRAPAPPPPMGGPVPPVGGGGLGAMARQGPVPVAKKGGKVKRAHGGSVSWLHAGAGSGEGRLEKENAYGAKSKTKARS